MHKRRLEFAFAVLYSLQNDGKDLFCLRFLFDSVGLTGPGLDSMSPGSNSHIVAKELCNLLKYL